MERESMMTKRLAEEEETDSTKGDEKVGCGDV